jgi:hypothetical protein
MGFLCTLITPTTQTFFLPVARRDVRSGLSSPWYTARRTPHLYLHQEDFFISFFTVY